MGKPKASTFLFQLLVLCLAVLWVECEETFLCPADTGMFPDASSKSRFYECRDGKATLHTCGTGTVFKAETKGCAKEKATAEKTGEASKETPITNTTAGDVATTSHVPDPSNTTTNSPGQEGNTHQTAESQIDVKAASDALLTTSATPDDMNTNATANVPAPGSAESTTTPSSNTTTTKTLSTSADTTTTKPTTITSAAATTASSAAKLEASDDEGDSKDEVPKVETYRGILDDADVPPIEDYNHPQRSELDVFDCPVESGFFRHPTNCSKFFWCVDNKPTPMFCSPGTAFDPDTNVCSWIVGEDGCGGQLQPAQHIRRRKRRADDDVRKGNHHVHDVTEESHEHEAIVESHHDHKSCDHDHGSQHDPHHVDNRDTSFLGALAATFSAIKKSNRSGRHPRQIVDDSYNDDEERSFGFDSKETDFSALHRSFQCPGDGFYADPEDCTFFYHCSVGKAYQHRCQPGTAFNPDKFVCSWPVGEDGCGGMLSVPYKAVIEEELDQTEFSINPNFHCPQHDGYYADPDNCTIFYHCTLGKPFKHRCGGGTAFNQEQGVCAWPLTENGCGGFLGVPYMASDLVLEARHIREDHSVSNKTSVLSKKADDKKANKTSEGNDSKGKDPSATTTPATTTAIKTPVQTTTKGIDTKAAKGKSYRQTTRSWPWDKVERKREMQRIVLPFDSGITKPVSTQTTTSTKTTTTPTTKKSSTTSTTSTMTSTTTQNTKSSTTSTVSTPKSSSSTPVSSMSQSTTTSPSTPSSASSTTKAPVTSATGETTPLNGKVQADTYRATDSEAGFRCPSPSGHFRDPMNCAIYYHCAGGVAYRMDCPDGKLYDIRQHDCFPIDEVIDCHQVDEKLLAWEEQWRNSYPETKIYPGRGDLQNSFQCPEAYGYFRHPEDCTHYIECMDGVPYNRKCLPGTVFDPKRSKCTWGSLVPDCHVAGGAHPPTENVEPADFQCPTSEGYYRDPFSCSAYYHCIDGKPMPRVCDPNFFFDPRASKCRWARLVQDCDQNGFPIFMEKLPLSSFVCPLPNGHFRDQNDCSVFYHCLRDYPYRGECRKHHAFDVETLTCKPRDQVPGCGWPIVTKQVDQVTQKLDQMTQKFDHVTQLAALATQPADHATQQADHVTQQDQQQATESTTIVSVQIVDDKDINSAATTFRCPTAHGLYRDAKDCRVFYHCFAGRHFRHECQFGTVFSTEKNLCTWPALVPECKEVTSQPDVTTYESSDPTSQTTSTVGVTHLRTDQMITNTDHKPFIPFYADGEVQSKFQRKTNTPTMSSLSTPKGQDYFTDSTMRDYGDGPLQDYGVGPMRDYGDEPMQDYGDRSFEYDLADPNRRHVPDISSDGLNDFRLEAPIPDPVVQPHMSPYSNFKCPNTIFDQYFRDPLDCTVFHRCVRGYRFTFNCPRGTFFDPVYDICDFMENVPDCDHEGRRTGAGSEPFGEFLQGPILGDHFQNRGESMSEAAPETLPKDACPKRDGLFPHPSSCQKFLYCSQGVPIVLTCPADLLYNMKTMTCDYDENIVCVRYDK